MELTIKVPYIDQVVGHIKRHKTEYIVGGVVVIAGITCLIMRRNIARGVMSGADAQGGSANTASFSFMFKSPQKIKITNVLAREGRGHPGWPVQNLETKKVFFSQKLAAEAFDIPEKLLSAHLNGKFPDVDGLHFNRVNLVPA